MLHRIAFACILAISAAHAQVPTSDNARQAQEKGTARCTAEVNVSRKATLNNQSGFKGSVKSGSASPSASGSMSSAGSSNMMGNNTLMPSMGANGIINSGAAATSPGFSLGAINIGATDLSGGGNTYGQFQIGNAMQLIQSVSSATSALATNNSSLSGFIPLVGTVASSQGGWDQNNAGRLGSSALWAQAVQAAILNLQMRNQRLMNDTTRSSGVSGIFKYDPASAVLVGVGGPHD